MNTGPVLQSNWDWRAASNFICGGCGSGMLIIFGVITQNNETDYGPVLLAALLICLGLTLVWLEIGRPLRFLNVYRNPFTSWMSRESYFATILVPLALAAFWFSSYTLLFWLALLAFLFLYSQARILKAATSITAWSVREITPFIISTGLIEGLGVLFMYWALVPGHEIFNRIIELNALLWILVITRLCAWYAYYEILKENVPRLTKSALQQAHAPFVLIGHILPVFLAVLGLFYAGLTTLCLFTAGLCLTVAGGAAKFLIITRAAFNQGYAIKYSPARGAGLPGPGIKPGWIAAKK